MSSAPISMQSATWAIPALPGAQNSFVHRGDAAIAQHRACSRPPPPTTRIRISQPLEMPVDSANMTIGHDHGHAAGCSMTKTMKASECKAKFLGVLDDVADNHERVIVTKNGRPVAQIIPYVEKPKSIIGAMKGSVTIMGDLDEPLDVEWEALKD
jgi:prevent-host-death family protein